MVKTEQGIVINKMGEGLSLRAEWYNDSKPILIKKEHINELLNIVVSNLFTIRDLNNNIYKR